MMDMRKIGEWIFLLGILLAVVAGILAAWLPTTTLPAGVLALVMLIIGIVVGFLNVTEKETQIFLIAAIALLSTSAVPWTSLNEFASIGTFIGTLLGLIGAFVAPAAVIVAIKAVWALAKEA